MNPAEIRIEKIWNGMGKGNILRLTHLPTGIQVTKDIGMASIVKEKNKLLKELEDKIKDLEKTPQSTPVKL